MIVAVCSDKGSPGVTTLATALALTWPGRRLVLEADPSGGDLSMRTRAPGLDYLAREPTILDFAMAVRSGAHGDGLDDYAQDSSAGVPVVPGPAVADGWAPMQHLWAQVAARLGDWPGTVVIDLGRFQPGHPGLALAETADVVLVLTRPTMDGLLRTRDRARQVQQILDRGTGSPGRVGVVVRAGAKDRRALDDVHQVLAASTPVVGGFADDGPAVEALWRGPDTADLRGSALLRSGHELIARIRRLWPDIDLPVDDQPLTGGPRRAGGGPRRRNGAFSLVAGEEA